MCRVGLENVSGIVKKLCERYVRGVCEVCLVGLDTASGIVERLCERNCIPVCEVCEELFRDFVRGM